MEYNQNIEDEQTISLSEIYEVIKKRFILLVITTLIGGLIVGGYAFFIATPKYKAKGAVVVKVENEDSMSNNIVNSQRLVQVTIDLLTEIDFIQETALTKLQDLDLDVSKIKKGMNVSAKSNSTLISITFVSEDKMHSKRVVDALIESLIEVTNDDDVYDGWLKGNIATYLAPIGKYDSPNKILFTFVGLLLGGVVGLVYVFIVEMVNSGYKTKDEFEKAINIQVLAEIPEYRIE